MLNQRVGQVPGCCFVLASLSFVMMFLWHTISSRKKLYLSTCISQHIAWYPPSQTFVCSAMDELKYQSLLPSPWSSGYAAGLQYVWQNMSFSECLHLKWKTSTVRPTFWNTGSFFTIFASWQLLSKKMCSGIEPGCLYVRFIIS